MAVSGTKAEKYIFQQIAAKGRAVGVAPDSTKKSREWFRTAAMGVTSVSTDQMMKDPTLKVTQRISSASIGQMHMFYYDALHKDTLPYWDRFPLIFVIGIVPRGFMGINLHYLPQYLRAKLMDALYTTANRNDISDALKLNISYKILNSAARYRYFKPCIKMYLHNQVASKFLIVPPSSWDTALMLPTERFQKASKDVVHAESAKMILKR